MTSDKELFESFCDLFDGNRMAVGTESGGCMRFSFADTWDQAIMRHLVHGGPQAIGVYPLRHIHPWGYGSENELAPGWYVRWGCVDFDDGEDISYAHACNVQQLLKRFGVTAWIERSRSKGYHVWVFASDWTPAWIMRRGLLMACTLVDAPTREINPKAEGSDDPEFLGNYIRLVYPDGFRTSQQILDARESSLAGWPNGRGGQLLRQQPQGSPAVHQGFPSDDRPRCGGAGSGDSWPGWDGVRRPESQQGNDQQPGDAEPETDLHVARPGDGGRLRSDRGAVPLVGRAPSGASDPLHHDVSSVGTPSGGFRRVVLDSSSGTPYTLDEFVRLAAQHRGIGQLQTLAEAYKPPAPIVHREVREIDDTAVQAALVRCRGLTALFIDEGPRDRGRSEWLFILGNQLVKDGLHSYDEMVALLAYADARHGEKFTHRRDAEQRYSEIIDKGLAEL